MRIDGLSGNGALVLGERVVWRVQQPATERRPSQATTTSTMGASLHDPIEIAEIVTRSESDWLKTNGFGRGSLQKLKDALAAAGFELGRKWHELAVSPGP